MDQVSIKYTHIFYCKTLQNLPKLEFLVWKQTIWQPWRDCQIIFHAFPFPFRYKQWQQYLTETIKDQKIRNYVLQTNLDTLLARSYNVC
jgi:hypothetical protein